MPTTTLPLNEPERADAVLREAAEVLSAGGLVVIPTETVYGVAASARRPEAMARLRALRPVEPERAYAIHVADAAGALSYFGDPAGLGCGEATVPPDPYAVQTARFLRKAFPGPFTVRLEVDEAGFAAAEPDEPTRRRLVDDGTVAFRCPEPLSVRRLLAAVQGPVVAGSAGAYAAEDLPDAVLGAVDLVLDAGPTRFAKPSTVVRLGRSSGGGSGGVLRATVERRGVYDQRIVDRMLQHRILLVCTGNTCRSPMAEAIARELTAALGRVTVSSAGVFAADGSPASPEAVEAMKGLGLDLTAHRSRYLTPDLVREADVIYTMTESHRQAVLSASPGAADKTFRLDPREDVADPIGGPLSDYQRTAAMIRRALQQRLTEIQG